MQEKERVQHALEKLPGLTVRHYTVGNLEGKNLHMFHVFIDTEENLKKMLLVAARHNFMSLLWFDDHDDKIVYTFGIPMFSGAMSFLEECG